MRLVKKVRRPVPDVAPKIDQTWARAVEALRPPPQFKKAGVASHWPSPPLSPPPCLAGRAIPMNVALDCASPIFQFASHGLLLALGSECDGAPTEPKRSQ